MSVQPVIGNRVLRLAKHFKSTAKSKKTQPQRRHFCSKNNYSFHKALHLQVHCTKDKLEDMDVSLRMSTSLSGPTPQTWIAQKLLNVSKSFFLYIKFWDICGYLQLVSCIFIKQSSNENILKKSFQVFKNLLSPQGKKIWFSEKCQKVLDFDNALWSNHSTHNKAKGIFG